MSNDMFAADNHRVVGDRAREAVAALRGFAYQIYASALAWTELDEDESLHLEVAEDYAIAARTALEAVQVKDTSGSGAVTINTAGVIAAIDSFVALTAVNPNRVVRLRFLSTSEIGVERPVNREFPNGVLSHWKALAEGRLDCGPLKNLLLRHPKLDARTQDFIRARDPDALRVDIVERIDWDCGREGLSDLKERFESALVAVARDWNISSYDARRACGAVVERILVTCSDAGTSRLLTSKDLQTLVDDLARVSIPTHLAMKLFERALGNGDTTAIWAPPSETLEKEGDLPLPHLLAERTELATKVGKIIGGHGFCLLTGSTGMGKSIVARLSARSIGCNLRVVDLRDSSPAALPDRLRSVASLVSGEQDGGVLLDDLNDLDDPQVQAAVGKLCRMLRRHRKPVIVTAYRSPSSKSRTALGIGPECVIAVPDMTRDEVGDLIDQAGGDSERWASTVHLGSCSGHPQLVQVLIESLQAKGWPTSDLMSLRSFEPSSDIEEERALVRARLIRTLPESLRDMLCRLSLVIGKFGRSLTGAIANVDPTIPMPGEKLDQLIGPWIDQVAIDEYRVSPLVANYGVKTLSEAASKATHSAIAHALLQKSIDPAQANAILAHGMLGKATDVLVALANSVLTAERPVRPVLAKELWVWNGFGEEVPVFSEHLLASCLLRLAQLQLWSDGSYEDGDINRLWGVLKRELSALSGDARTSMEIMAFSYVLVRQTFTGRIDTWVADLSNLALLLNHHSDHPVLRRHRGAKDKLEIVRVALMCHVTTIEGTAQLLAVFEEINALPADGRALLIASLGEDRESIRHLVESAWLKDDKAKATDWQHVAEALERCATLATAWPAVTLAMNCVVTTAVVLNEYLGDEDGARSALDRAEQLGGQCFEVTRARVKMLFRKDDSEGVIALARSWPLASTEPSVTLAYMYREFAVSFAARDEWSQASEWFERAELVARSVNNPRTQPLEIGLVADHAVALFHAGDARAALSRFVEALQYLSRLDSAQSVNAYCCHVLVRHAVMWFFANAAKRIISHSGIGFAMIPGACSNPDPHAGLADGKLISVDVAWYLLAEIECELLIPRESVVNLTKELSGRSPALELGLRRTALSVESWNGDEFSIAEALKCLVDAVLAFNASDYALNEQNVLGELPRAQIPSANLDDLSNPVAVHLCRDVLALSLFGVVIRNDRLSLSHLAATLDSIFGEGYAGCDPIRVLLSDDQAPYSDSWALIAGVAGRLHRTQSLSLRDLFVCCIRLLEWIKNPAGSNALRDPIADWIVASWLEVSEHRRFELVSPATSVATIRDAAESRSGVARAAAVVLAAESAISRKTIMVTELRAEIARVAANL